MQTLLTALEDFMLSVREQMEEDLARKSGDLPPRALPILKRPVRTIPAQPTIPVVAEVPETKATVPDEPDMVDPESIPAHTAAVRKEIYDFITRDLGVLMDKTKQITLSLLLKKLCRVDNVNLRRDIAARDRANANRKEKARQKQERRQKPRSFIGEQGFVINNRIG